MKVNIDQKNILFILFITFLLLSSKWVISYLNFPNEDINLSLTRNLERKARENNNGQG